MNIETLLRELIRIPTTADHPERLKEVVDVVDHWFADWTRHKERFERNGKHSLYLNTREGRHSQVLFVGHLDVVPAEHSEQFEPRVEGRRLYGRGALDMKGPDAVMIRLFLDLMAQSRVPSCALMLTTDEEVGSRDGVEWLVKEQGIGADFVIVPDGGSSFRLIYAEKGALHLRVKARGKAAHGSQPWLGDNAIDQLIRAYQALRQWIDAQAQPEDPEHWYPTLNLGRIQGGRAPNIVADEAWMDLDFRFPGPTSPREFLRQVKEILHTSGNFELEDLTTAVPVETDRDHPLFQRFLETMESVLGRPVQLAREHGATDARHFAEKGMPVVILYPVGDGIHGPNEWVDLPSLDTLYAIFKAYVDALPS